MFVGKNKKLFFKGEIIMWRKLKENGIWLAKCNRFKFMFKNHDALYIAIGKFRLRIMKP